MIPYDPKDATSVLPAGEYPAAISTCEQKQSKAGNDMYELSFDVWYGERQAKVFDYIVMPSFTWKLKRLARALGVEEAFESGKFDPIEHIGSNLVLTLEIDKQAGYDEKNIVRGYSAGSAPPPASASFTDAVDRERARMEKKDDLPF